MSSEKMAQTSAEELQVGPGVHWNPSAAHELQTFAANRGMGGQADGLVTAVNGWASMLHGRTIGVFDFGRYVAEVVADRDHVISITFDMFRG